MGTGTTVVNIQLVRGSTSIGIIGYGVYASGYLMAYVPGTYLDSPSSTSAVTYKTQFKTNGNGIYANYDDGAGDAVSTITLMEIAV